MSGTGNLNAVAYRNGAGYIRLRKANPTECAGCRRPVSAARPNLGALYYCASCHAEVLDRLHDDQVRADEHDAFEKLAERIAAYEAEPGEVAA